jgi:hypothetical protein
MQWNAWTRIHWTYNKESEVTCVKPRVGADACAWTSSGADSIIAAPRRQAFSLKLVRPSRHGCKGWLTLLLGLCLLIYVPASRFCKTGCGHEGEKDDVLQCMKCKLFSRKL